MRLSQTQAQKTPKPRSRRTTIYKLRINIVGNYDPEELVDAIAPVAGNGAIALRYRDTIYPGVMIWALIAIAQRQAELMPVGLSAIVGAAILGGAIARSVFR